MEREKQTWAEDTLEALGAVVIVDNDCRIVYMSSGYERMFGLKRGEALGRRIQDLVPGEGLSAVIETGREDRSTLFWHGEQSMIVNRMLIRKNGKVVGGFALNATSLNQTDKQLAQNLSYIGRQLQFYREKFKEDTGTKHSIEEIITRNAEMLHLIELTKRVSKSRSNILVSGESGTGKELFSHAIHNLSERVRMPFVALNCAAIPETLLESELFGYADGAFTGAVKGGRKGRIEMADGGTLLLDEINSMPIHLQAKLLRAVQEREIQVVGGGTRRVDVRFIFTTNQDLAALVREGKFRADLYYRINVVELRVPPLRERKEDIEPLVYYFISKLNAELGLYISGVSKEVFGLLDQYDWPGNVRELENMVERAMDLAASGELRPEHFDRLSKKLEDGRTEPLPGTYSLRAAREETEKAQIAKVLRLTGGNRKRAAELLEIDRSVLYDKMAKYGIGVGHHDV